MSCSLCNSSTGDSKEVAKEITTQSNDYDSDYFSPQKNMPNFSIFTHRYVGCPCDKLKHVGMDCLIYRRVSFVVSVYRDVLTCYDHVFLFMK